MPSRTGAAALVLIATLPMAAWTPATAANPGWLADLMTQLAAIPERHVTFREEKHFAALDTPLISQGQLIYRRPAHLEKITTAPDPETLVVDGDRLTFTANNAAPQSFRFSRHPEVGTLVDAVRGTLAGDLSVLESHYHISAAGSLAAWHLVLQPADPDVRHLVRDIAIDGTGTDIRDFLTTQTNGDEQIVTIATSR
jgi:outer membrane lipoprotein-sorting protein